MSNLRPRTRRAGAHNANPLSEIPFFQSSHDCSPWKRVPTRADATNQLQEQYTQVLPRAYPGVSRMQPGFVKNFFSTFLSNPAKARGSYEVCLKPVRVSICVSPWPFLAMENSPEGPISQDPPTPENREADLKNSGLCLRKAHNQKGLSCLRRTAWRWRGICRNTENAWRDSSLPTAGRLPATRPAATAPVRAVSAALTGTGEDG